MVEQAKRILMRERRTHRTGILCAAAGGGDEREPPHRRCSARGRHGCGTAEMKKITAGFIPLLDCAVIVAAVANKGSRGRGLDVRLVHETSWANIRDRLVIGHFDVAHMLGPMAVASTLGVGHQVGADCAVCARPGRQRHHRVDATVGTDDARYGAAPGAGPHSGQGAGESRGESCEVRTRAADVRNGGSVLVPQL